MNRAAARALRAVWAWLPAALRVDARERWRAVAGATLGLLVAALVSRWAGAQLAISPWLAAPLGASAVLVFAVPASPLAQPWSVIGGNTLSALVGLACARLLPDAALAAAVAVGAAIALMFLLRCLHPPGGATALLAVLTHATDWRFALLPVLLNSALLVLVGVAYNSLTGRRYPHVQLPPAAPAESPPGARFTSADLDAALAHYNQVLDVSRDDLEQLLHHAEAAAYQRNLGELRCRDIMSRAPLTVNLDTPVGAAWARMRAREVKALPVIDRSNNLVGIVTLADFVRAMVPEATRPGALPQRVGEIMTRRVRVASEDLHVIELLPLFSEGGHHHLPVVDAQQHLVGILTQSDLVRALHRAVRPD
jgi:CBS domain-containing membrane protein